MAKLSRIFLSRYGKDGIVNDYAQFGSKAAAAPINTLNIATIQALAAWGTGLKDTLLGGQRAPFLEDDNAWRLVHAYMTCYLLQEGIPEWDPSTTYFINSWVKKPGTDQIYSSKQDNNIGQTPPNLGTDDHWRLIFPIDNENILDGAISTDKYGDGTITDGKIVGMNAVKLLGDLLVTNAGIVSMAKQPSFRAGKSGDQNVTGPNDTAITFETVSWDAGSNYNSGTGLFTAPVAGKYLVMANLTMFTSSNAETLLKVFVNGIEARLWFASAWRLGSGFYQSFAACEILNLTPGDTVGLRLKQNGGSAIPYRIASGVDGSFFGMQKLS